MSYDIIAKSTDSARPVELYQIIYSGRRWYYTNADRPITIASQGITYTPAVIDHDDIDNADDVFANGLTVSFEETVGFADLFNPVPPSEVVRIIVLATNYLVDNEFVVFWNGRVTNSEFDNGGWLKLTTQSNFSALQQQGLRRKYSRNCPYALYDPRTCKVSDQYLREQTTIVGLNGLNVVANSALGRPDNYYAGGYITWINSSRGNLEKRMIRSSVGASGRLTLSGFPVGMPLGVDCNLYPGCPHTISACATKFNNEDNFGGTPYIPSKNPFNGSIIY